MFIENFYTEKDSRILISKQQASNFAKQIADDFNPIHDPDSKYFCVPGDLLFSLILEKYGLSQQMTFTFSGMVGDNIPLHFPENISRTNTDEFSITDDDEKQYLRVEHQGDISTKKEMISEFTKNYVAFSGTNFPDVIVPLMAEHNVMINPDRPLVIYDSMSISLDTVDMQHPTLEPIGSSLKVQGKKAIALLEFAVKSEGKTIGQGLKRLALRGLREFDQERVEKVIDYYNERKINLAPKSRLS